MRIDEITKLEGKALHEAIDVENDTGFKTEDLVKIVEAHRKDEWKTFDTTEALIEHLNKFTEKARG